MILDFEPFHRAKNTVGKQDYFSTRITTTKKIKTCCECLFTIAIGEEHHQAIGFWDANYNDWRTCLKCYELQIELENTSVRLNSMLDFRFGKFSKRLKALRSRYPDEFAAFEDEFDLTEIMKRIEKKTGWRDVPMQVHIKLRSSSDVIYCCQCSWDLDPKTRYEEATITKNHEVLGVNRTCLKCVEKRKILEPYFQQYPEDDRLLTTYRRDSISKALRKLSDPDAIAQITDPNLLKFVNDYIAANKQFYHEAEEEFTQEIERRQSGFIPPTTPYEFKLKAALEKDGYEVIHNEPIGYYFPDLLIEEHKCILEVDGLYHATDYQQAKDAYRTEYLNSKGYFVVRVSNERITHDLRLVMREIRDAIAAKENINLA
jgi:very-short-patch-repair endonuclease